MVEKRGLKELERRVALVLAQSLSNIKFLEWTATKPETASLKIEVDQDNSTLVFLGCKGSALLTLDGEPFWSLDGYHKSVQVKKGRHEIGAEFTPYLAFGEKTQIQYGTPILALCDPVAYKLWIHCSMALELAKQTKDKEVASDLFDALTSSLELAYFESATHEQLALAGYLFEKFPKELVSTIPETSAALKELGYREGATPGKWQEALSDLEERLHVLVEKYGKRGRILGIGHGHIDTAWLWPFAETEKKVARTFSVVSTLLDREPDFHYIQSMALYYDWIKKSHPELYERIKGYVKEGRWELGAGWVENDANMLSGESFARQLLYSQQFYQNEFGKLARVYWLPDSFGFAASIPQIAKLAGIRFFATHKLFWNDTNTFPYALFNWVGIDGTSLPSIYFGQGRDGYNSSFAIEEVIDQWTNWADKDIDLPMLYAFGYGDGGGGPTEDMFLKAEALDKLPILPRVQLTGPVSSDKSYLERNYSRLLSGEIGKNSWRGELYVETHRGVQTSHSRMKYLNRRAEFSLREAELWSTILWSTKRSDNTAYHKELGALWKILLKHQFHDVLPGSSINEVYAVAYTELERVVAEADSIANQSMKELAGLPADSNHSAGEVVLFNSLPWRRTEYVVLPIGVEGSQRVDNGYLAKVSLPSVGFASKAKAVSANPSVSILTVHESESLMSVENQFFKIELEKRDGSVLSLFDKEAQREILKAKSNHFVFYENVPGWADAWDIEKGYKNTQFDSLPLERCEVLEKGPLRVRIKTSRKFRHSTIDQELFIYAESRRIDFKTTTDLHDRELLLKVWFHFDLNTDSATYEIPFGSINRKTTSNTSWEKAKFEVPMLKWADLSESDYGVALLNDGRYGVAAENTSFGLSVAKTPIYPDFAADSEPNTFTYSAYPHKGGWEHAEVPQRAYELNSPIRMVSGSTQGKGSLATEPYRPDEKSFVTLDSNNLMLEAVKVSEDQSRIILRLYEMHNRRGTANLHVWTSLASVAGTDLLESPTDSHKLLSSKDRLVIPYRNHQIVTVKARLT